MYIWVDFYRGVWGGAIASESWGVHTDGKDTIRIAFNLPKLIPGVDTPWADFG